MGAGGYLIDWATSGDKRDRSGFLGKGRMGRPLISGDVVEEESPAVDDGDLEDAGIQSVSFVCIAMPRRSELGAKADVWRTSPLSTSYAVGGKETHEGTLLPVAATETLSREELSMVHW